MHPDFAQLTPQWFKRAFVYTGSIGDFRYRFQHDKDGDMIHAAVYSVYCYEKATDVVEASFPWDDDGVAALQKWLQERLDTFQRA